MWKIVFSHEMNLIIKIVYKRQIKLNDRRKKKQSLHKVDWKLHFSHTQKPVFLDYARFSLRAALKLVLLFNKATLIAATSSKKLFFSIKLYPGGYRGKKIKPEIICVNEFVVKSFTELDYSREIIVHEIASIFCVLYQLYWRETFWQCHSQILAD